LEQTSYKFKNLQVTANKSSDISGEMLAKIDEVMLMFW
jgi:hypothetical protein